MFEFGKSIPVKVTWPFFVVAALIGFLNSLNLIGTLFWIIVIFVSVLIHEYGHALTSKFFGQRPRIELFAFGGLTYPERTKISGFKEFLVILAGPMASLALSFLGFFIFALPEVRSSPYAVYPFLFGFVNAFWTVVNLLPILPLDGGQLLRIFLEGVFQNRGLFLAGVLSCVFATTLALIAFLMSNFIVGAILFLFAFQNFELVKQARYLSSSDQQEVFRKRLQDAVVLFEAGQFEQVEPLLKSLIEDTKQGMIFHQALAMQVIILRMKKDYKTIYESLKPYPKLFETDLSAIMHEASFFQNDMAMVQRLSLEAFQKENTADTAFHSAVACATLKNDEAALGWLKTAQELGMNVDEIKAHPVLKAYAEKLT